MTTNEQIRQLHAKSCDLALKEVERQAREILKANPQLKEFVMAMGSAFFSTHGGDTFRVYEKELSHELSEFIEEWDEYLKLTGNPMRFTATGKKITNW